MTALAARGSGWGGAVVGIVAAAIFVAFSSWIVVQRLRADHKVQRLRSNRKDVDG
ncbi:MAG: hypothetical protein QOJ03_805 [Frankiaceae bacterium]|jgi:hypothetical protein|nr:hypothetical protein [Frankiaceae bacterium]